MTYLQILNLIKDTALAQPNVNSVVREFLDLNREDAKYSAIVIQDRDGSRDRNEEQDYITYTWHLGYVDRLTYDESNRDDIISTGINIIDNIMNTIRNTWFPELEVSIVDRINTFNQRFTAQCAGVYVVLAVNAQVSDCVDSESTDLYDTYDAKITANGVYHFVPSGRPVDEINITVDVAGPKKEEVSLTDTVTMNGIHTYIPEEDTVYKDVELTVDVHPTERLVETYTTNGVKTITGEFNGGVITVDVPNDGWDQKSMTEGTNIITNLDNSASFVASGAFQNNKNIQTVNLPYATTVGDSAFYSCSSLSKVNLPVCSFIGNEAFYDTNLTSLTLGSNSVVSLSGYNQFFPTDILSIYVPGSLYNQYITNHKWISYSSHIVEPLIWYDNGTLGGSITEMSRTDWESLGISGADIQRVNFDNAGSFSTGTFKDCTNLSQANLNNWQLTESEVFMGCTSLKSITHTDLHQGGLILGDTRGLFSGCTNLSSLGSYIFNSLGDYMFAGTALTSYKLYPRTNYIGNYVFQSCTSLTEIDLKDMKSIVEAGTSIFDGCTNLSVIYINNEGYRTAQGWSEYSSLMSLINIPAPALDFENGLLYGSISAISSTDLTELRIVPMDILYVSLPNCTSVSMGTFRRCDNLTSVSLPMCEYIGNGAFQDCWSLSQVSLPVCSYIGNGAFYGCYSLSQVSLPVCSYIGNNAFDGCSLSIITIGYSSICMLTNDNAFYGTPIGDGTGSIYVPASLVDAYKTAENWSMYSSQIFTIPS